MTTSLPRKAAQTLRISLFSLCALAGSVIAAPVNGPIVEQAKSENYKDITANVDPETAARGKGVYDKLCINCHEHGLNRAPQRFTLSFMTPESILAAMTDGIMREQTAHLSLDEKRAVAQFLSNRKLGSGAEAAAPPMCSGKAASFDVSQKPVLKGWGFDEANSHVIPDDSTAIDRKNVGKLKLKWALSFPGAVRARSQPLIAAGALFVGSQPGTVYALDLETGCVRWTYQASAEVKVGILISDWDASDKNANPLLFFGDLIGNQYAVRAFTGEMVWKKRMDDHPGLTLSGTATLVGDTLFVPTSSLEEGSASDPTYPCCTFRGSLVALDAATGNEIRRTYFIEESSHRGKNESGADQYGPSGVPIWTSAAVDRKRGLIYVATGDNYSSPATDMSDSIIAVEIDTGRIRWSYQATADDAWNGSCDEIIQHNCPEEDGPDVDFGSSPVLAVGSDGKQYVLAADKAGQLVAVDPDTGKLAWKKRVGRGGVVGGILFGMAAREGVIYVPVSDVPDGRSYDIPARPGLYAVDIASGDYVWEAPAADNVCNGRPACYPGYQTVPSATSELVFAGSNDGMLRAYDIRDGKVLWETDTAQSFTTVSGDTASGGSVGGSSAAIAVGGKLITNSGYGFAGKMPGGVLLVYAIE